MPVRAYVAAKEQMNKPLIAGRMAEGGAGGSSGLPLAVRAGAGPMILEAVDATERDATGASLHVKTRTPARAPGGCRVSLDYSAL